MNLRQGGAGAMNVTALIYSGSRGSAGENARPIVSGLGLTGRGYCRLSKHARNSRSQSDVAAIALESKEICYGKPAQHSEYCGPSHHPMLIPFPIAFFIATFVCDLVYWQTGNAGWVTATMWLLGAGLVMAAL